MAFMEQLASLYGVQAEALRRSAQQGNYNETYEFERDGITHMLRVSPQYHELQSLQRNMRYLQEHARLGSPVIEPLASANGRLVEMWPPGAPAAQQRLVTAAVKAPGDTHEVVNDASIPAMVYGKVGEALARMHNNAAALGTARWEFAPWFSSENCFNVSEFPEGLSPVVKAKYEELYQHCRTMTEQADTSVGSGTWGVIHGDLHFSNIIINNSTSRVTFCDFDDACLGFFAMDLALMVFDLKVILQGNNKEQQFQQALADILVGYNAVRGRQVRPLTAADLAQWLQLLELSMFIQCWPLLEEARAAEKELTGWLGLFFAGRQRRILADQPYLSAECGD